MVGSWASRQVAIMRSKRERAGQIRTCARCGKAIKANRDGEWRSVDRAGRYSVAFCPGDEIGRHGVRPRKPW